MPEIIHCPRCRRKLQAPESSLGQDVQCPRCGATFALAVAVQPAPARALPPRPRGEPPEPPGDPDRPPSAEAAQVLPHRGGAVLTVGVLALVGLVICLPAVLLGPLAWAMGSSDLALIRAGRMDRAGRSATANGLTCGLIATALGVLGLVLTCYRALSEGDILSVGD
jgi:hypothetical protein